MLSNYLLCLSLDLNGDGLVGTPRVRSQSDSHRKGNLYEGGRVSLHLSMDKIWLC